MSGQMSDLEDVLSQIDADMPASLDRLIALLKIPSISTDPDYRAHCRTAADWLAKELESMGLEADVRQTSGHPIVVGHDRTSDQSPHVLFYGHYDVQPIDPIELWKTAPFEPTISRRSDGTEFITARGAADDKGQLMTFIEACRAWKVVHGALPIKVSMLFEGEEETGSRSLASFLEENVKELSVDLALVCDTGMWNPERPAIFVALRGLVTLDVAVTAAHHDLHSGIFGSAARNPIHVLVEILAGLHDNSGRVSLPGFYVGVDELPPEIRTQWDHLGFDERAFLGSVGLSVPAGETDRSVFEQTRSRPTCEINGLGGGHSGVGFKTVIPCTANAKVSFRLVGKQDPQEIVTIFQDFVRARLPADCSAEFIIHSSSPALKVAHDQPHLLRASRAITDEWSVDPVLMHGGGSIAALGEIQRVLGLDPLMVGFSLLDDGIHAANEKYEFASFRRGIRSWARILSTLGEDRTRIPNSTGSAAETPSQSVARG